jgi:hypothetical protein
VTCADCTVETLPDTVDFVAIVSRQGKVVDKTLLRIRANGSSTAVAAAAMKAIDRVHVRPAHLKGKKITDTARVTVVVVRGH